MKVRVRFTKTGKVRWTSHRDVARMWERAFRRTGLALTYTEGFSPRPKVAFGLALPTGHESLAEYLDLDLIDEIDPTTLAPRLSPALPDGVDVTAAVALEAGGQSLQHEVTSCTWQIEVVEVDPVEVERAAAAGLAAESLVVTRERKGKQVTDDIRPAVLALSAEGTVLHAEVATLERGVRPVELLRAVLPTAEQGLVRRTHQWIERDGARWEPIPLLATDAPHAQVRAS